MRHIWLSVTLIVIALIINLLGVFKDAFLPQKTPRWFFFVIAILPILGAVLQIYQDVKSLKIDKGVTSLAAGITPQSDPKTFTQEEQELLLSLIKEVNRVQPGESKLFVAPSISSKTFYNLGLVAFNQRDFVQAENYLKASLKEDENEISAFNLLLQLYQSAAMNHLQDREIEAAELSLKKAAQLMDNAPPGINLRTVTLMGYIYKSLGQVYEKSDPQVSEKYWEEAGKIFNQALVSNEKDPGALNGIGNVLTHEGRLLEALEKHVRALEVAPNYTAAANDAAIVCEMLMRQDPSRKEEWKTKGIEFWELAVELSKNDPQFPSEYASQISNRISWLRGQ